MSIVYRLKANKIDSHFLEQIKATFGDKKIEIVVSELDETEYFFESKNNKYRLLKAVENVKARQNLVQVDLQDLP